MLNLKSKKMRIIEIENRFYYEASMIETFPFPAPGAVKATKKDFQTYRDIKKIFKLGFVFFHQNAKGFYDKYTTTTLTNRKDLSKDIENGKIFIVREQTINH